MVTVVEFKISGKYLQVWTRCDTFCWVLLFIRTQCTCTGDLLRLFHCTYMITVRFVSFLIIWIWLSQLAGIALCIDVMLYSNVVARDMLSHCVLNEMRAHEGNNWGKLLWRDDCFFKCLNAHGRPMKTVWRIRHRRLAIIKAQWSMNDTASSHSVGQDLAIMSTCDYVFMPTGTGTFGWWGGCPVAWSEKKVGTVIPNSDKTLPNGSYSKNKRKFSKILLSSGCPRGTKFKKIRFLWWKWLISCSTF